MPPFFAITKAEEKKKKNESLTTTEKKKERGNTKQLLGIDDILVLVDSERLVLHKNCVLADLIERARREAVLAQEIERRATAIVEKQLLSYTEKKKK